MPMLLKNPLFWISIGVIIIALVFIIPGVYLLWIVLGAVFVALPTYLVDDLPVYVALLFLVPSILLTIWIGMLWRGKPKKEAPKVTIKKVSHHQIFVSPD